MASLYEERSEHIYFIFSIIEAPLKLNLLDQISANRITTMHDFGYVALNMKYVNPEDSGTYTCRAVNDLGEAITSAVLDVKCMQKIAIEEANLHEIVNFQPKPLYNSKPSMKVPYRNCASLKTQAAINAVKNKKFKLPKPHSSLPNLMALRKSLRAKALTTSAASSPIPTLILKLNGSIMVNP